MSFLHFLKLGTGNGAMLFELSDEEYTNLTGVDYSEKSVELAQKIAVDQERGHINFKVCDLLANTSDLGRFNICHDKGTYDAIGLMHNAADKKQIYTENVANLLTDRGLFIITSCNFTEDELTKSFSEYFDKFEVIPSQTFQFGGKVGKTTTSMCFKKREKATNK
jgi:SAM-dependent methyltransferase